MVDTTPDTSAIPSATNSSDATAPSRTVLLTRVVSVAEATSFLLLLAATVVKYAAGHPGGVKILGPIHGVLFLAYCALVVMVGVERRWKVRRTLLALGASILPVAPYLVEHFWLRTSPRHKRS